MMIIILERKQIYNFKIFDNFFFNFNHDVSKRLGPGISLMTSLVIQKSLVHTVSAIFQRFLYCDLVVDN